MTEKMEGYIARRLTDIAHRKLVLSSLLAACALISGCKDAGTVIWTGEAQSPDKHFVASARTVQFSGPGAAGVFTAISLKQDTRSAVEILELANETAYPPGITAVGLNWVTPSRLNITYRGHASIEFQAIKCAGVEISVEQKE